MFLLVFFDKHQVNSKIKELLYIVSLQKGCLEVDHHSFKFEMAKENTEAWIELKQTGTYEGKRI